MAREQDARRAPGAFLATPFAGGLRLACRGRHVCRREPAIGILVALVLVCGSAVCASAQPADYVVGPQDVLTITVWDQRDLSGRFSVEADGTFIFPLIGTVKAGGQTLRAIEAELGRLLRDGYVKNPQLSVTVDQYRSQRIFVVGEVRQPGTFTLAAETTIIEVLSRAGSTTPDAVGDAVIVRPRPGSQVNGPLLPAMAQKSEVLRINLKELQEGGLSQNITLRDGDTVYVPRGEKIYVLGQVRTPGAYSIENGTTLLQALSLAGGVTDRGSTGRIRIVRIVGGNKKEMSLKLDDLVQAGDTIVVRERFF